MGFVALLSYIVPFQAGADHRAGIRRNRNSWPEYNFRTGVFEREPVPANIDSDILATESIIIPDDKLKHALIRCQPQQDELEQLRARLRKMSGRGIGSVRQGREKSVPGPEMSRDVQTTTGRGACRVEAQAPESALISVPGASSRRWTSPALP